MSEVSFVTYNIYLNFDSERHNCCLSDVSVTMIDKTNIGNPAQKEHYWCHIFKVMTGNGLNFEDDW